MINNIHNTINIINIHNHSNNNNNKLSWRRASPESRAALVAVCHIHVQLMIVRLLVIIIIVTEWSGSLLGGAKGVSQGRGLEHRAIGQYE